MANEIVVSGVSLPANIAAMFGDDDKNDLTGGVGQGFPIMSIKGKTWTIARGKDKQMLMNSDGDPRASIEVVIVKGNKHLSKVYYKEGFQEGSAAKPTCYSNDSMVPALDATEKQAANCATCRHNQWGSRIGEGGQKGKACSDSRRIAIAPAGLLNDPMLLRVPAASLKPLMEYNEELTKRSRKYQLVVTKLGFDPAAPSPKLTFKYVRDVNAAEAQVIVESMNSDTTTKILGEGFGFVEGEQSSGGTAKFDSNEKFEQARPEPTPVVEKVAKPAAKPMVVADDDLSTALKGILGDENDD